jgi:hypothetical protein
VVAGDLGRPVEGDQVHRQAVSAHGRGVAQHLQGTDRIQLVEPLEHHDSNPHPVLLPGWTLARAA